MSRCVIYAILRPDTAEVKLGISRDMRSRLICLQASHAVPLTVLGTWPGNQVRERRVHNKWAHLRLCGEWFRYTPELAAWIAEQADDTRVGKCGSPDCRSDCAKRDDVGVDCEHIAALVAAADGAA